MTALDRVYDRSAREATLLALQDPTGSLALIQRPRDAEIFSGHLGLPELPPEGIAGLLAAGEEITVVRQETLCAWTQPPVTTHQASFQVELLRLGRPAELRQGHWCSPAQLVRGWQEGALLLEPPVLELIAVLATRSWQEGTLLLEVPVPSLVEILAGTEDHALPSLEGPLEVHPRVTVLPLPTPTLEPATHTNCTLFGNCHLAIIDPGSPWPEAQARLEHHLERETARGRFPAAVLLTHHHPDHIGGAARLRTRFGIPILAHAYTAERLAAEGLRIDGYLEPDARFRAHPDEPVLQALFTPGHAPGHLCFWDPAARVLVAGDMVAGWGTIVVAPPEGNMRDYLDSLRRLRALQPRVLIPAHGSPLGGAVEKIDAYLEHRLLRERQVLALLETAPNTAAGLVPWIYAGLPSSLHFFAQLSLQAHLDKLLAESRVVAWGEVYFLNDSGSAG